VGGGGKTKISPNDNGCENTGGFNWLRMTKRVCEHVNPLNTQLNPICHLLALLGAHQIFHVSRIRVNEPIDFTKGAVFFSSSNDC
jgi:hypothetical protein